MKNLCRRTLAIVFSVLMVVASIPLTTIAIGSNDLANLFADNTATVNTTSVSSQALSEYVATNTIAVDKEKYAVGESIQVTTDVDTSQYPDAWVGLFRDDITPTADKYVYWYGFKGGLKPYGTYDIFAVAQYNSANDSYAQPELYGGTFKVVLFGTNDASTVLSTATFTVTDQNSNVNGQNSISTTKNEYIYGEALTITASSNTSGAWVGLYSKGAVPTYGGGTAISHAYYYIDNYNGAAVVSNNLFVKNDGTNALYGSIPVGEYDLYLITGDNKVGAKTSVKICEATINLDKTEYNYGDNVIINAQSSTASSGAWVGLYKTTQLGGGHPNNQIISLAWYYLSAYGGKSLTFQDLATNDYGTGLQNPLEPGDYIVYIFGDSGYGNVQATKTFTVYEDVAAHFDSADYQIDNLTDGFANGKVQVKLASDSFHMIGRADVSLYWADIDGNILSDYTALAKFRITDLITVADLYEHTIIPEGAKTLKAFVNFNGVDGTEGYIISLPDNCATFDGLDENILSEFQMVSDLHITDDVTTGMDGEHHVHDNEHFRMMLRDIASNSKNSQGIFVNGDIANNGLQSEYEYVKSIYNTVNNTTGRKLPPMYVSLGNHDSYPGNINDFISYAQSLGADMETDKPYYAQNVNGYNYIFLGGDNPAYYGLTSATINSNDAELSAAQLQWLDQQLADNETNNDGKPVFVMLHQAIANTVAGSFDGQDWDGVVNVDDLKAVLSKYNNVILLGGHSHWEINSPNNMYPGSADLPVAINTASVGYLWSDYNSSPDGYYIPGTQGFYVRVYEDKVVFLGRDFENQKWIPSACYVIYNEDVQGTPVFLSVEDVKTVDEYLSNVKGRELSFETSDNNIVSVDSDGTMTAIGIGPAVITVTALPSDTEVVKREKITVTVTNQTISDDIAQELGEPLNLGDDFSAYIGFTKGGKDYFLTIPGDDITNDRNAAIDKDAPVSQGFKTNTESSKETIYYPEFLEKDNKAFSVRQFWDFELQDDDGSYIIYNTWTNATHTAEDAKAVYALDGASYNYYKYELPVPENDVDNGLLATRFYYDKESYTSGEYTNYYRWFIYQDDNGNYYLQNKHSRFILSIMDDVYTHYFGQMGKMLTDEQMADSTLVIDRIAQQDNIKMSLFDYGKYINNNSYIAKEARKLRETGVNTFDASKNDNILWFNQDEWNKNYVVDGVASKGNDYVDIETIGRYTQYDSTPLMLKSLDSTGYPYVNNVTYHDWGRQYGEFTDYPAFGSDSGSLKYLFDKDMTYVTGDSNSTLTAENYNNGYYQSVRYDVGDSYGSGLFREDANGGMVYSSYLNAAYFDTSEFYETGAYQPLKGQRFQIYDYVIRPYYHYYYNENVIYTDSDTGVTYDEGIYNTLIKSTRLDTFGENSLFNNRYLRKSLRDYNSYNRNFLPFNYGHNITNKDIQGNYDTDAYYSSSVVDPAQPGITSTNQATKHTSFQQDTPQIPAYYNETYADSHGASYENSQETNLWFGMTMEFDFEIANNGQIRDMNGNLQDMVFNFTGDDDVLVYIDNVLVLNVAGTHGAQMATINFATGNVAHPTDESCYPAVGIDTSESSTIKAKFEAAYAEAAAEDSNSILAGTTLNEDMFEGNTFANGTRHTLKFFYLERGGSRSFCDIYFNMETLPSSGFEVEKKSVDAQGNDVTAKDNSDYTFIITGHTNDGEALTSGTYTYDVVNTSTHAIVSANLKVEQGNTITLKSGQKAVFKDLRVDYQYTVTEIVDPCYVKGVTTYLDNKLIDNMTVQQDHMVSCTAATYIPVVEDGISNVTFVNTVEQVSVSIKYYDREVVSGKPADMGSEPQVYVHKFYGTDIKFVDEDHSQRDTEAMIAEAGNALVSGQFSGVNNFLDDYYLWLSQEQAIEGMKKIINLHTGEYYVETPYHTNQYGQVQTGGEKWVNISDDGKDITSWMYNRPAEQTITVYSVKNSNTSAITPISGTDLYVAVDSCDVLTGYYNQRFGDSVADSDNQGYNDNTNYLTSYNIPAVNGSKITTAETVVVTGANSQEKTLGFLYWAFDAEGTQIASTDIDYCYRITGQTTLYAIYGEKGIGNGITVSKNQPDFFSLADNNGNSVEYVRLNTIMNTYGYPDNFHVGGDYSEAGDGIKDVAVVYVNVKNDAFDADNISDAQLLQLREGVEQIVKNAQSLGMISGKSVEVTVEKTTTDGENLEVTDESVTFVANGFKYKVVAKQENASDYGENEVYLTTKNRIQFTTTFKKAQLEKLRLFAFAAIRVVENGESNWVVSDNYIDYNLCENTN